MSARGGPQESEQQWNGRVGRALLRAAPAAGAAAFLWWRGRRRAPAVLAMLALALFVLGLVAPAAAAALDRGLARLGHLAARAVSWLLGWSAWLLAVLPVWALSRLVGYSPLDPGWASPSTAWTMVDRSRMRTPDLRPDRPGRSGQVELRPAPSVRRRAVLRLAPLLVLLVAMGAWTYERRTSAPSTANVIDLASSGGPLVTGQAKDIPDAELEFNGYPVDDYAHEGEPWFRDHVRELLGMNSIPDLVVGARNGEFDGRTLRVVDGRRVTYTPDDPTLEVWFFGGSTMFGIGQRDDHTIPSVIARLAEDDGLRIRATNFGVSGDVNWQETIRFAEALDDPDLPRPDLVVFYDGVNDRGLASVRVTEGDVDPSRSSRLPVSDAERAQRAAAFPGWEEPAFGVERDQLEVSLASAQYARGAATARRLAEANGIPVVFVWQPQPFAATASPATAELYRRLDFDPAILPASTRTYREIRERSGVEPIDLTDVFDGFDVPIFFDSSHTNELGARVVATELYEQLRPQLDRAEARR